MKFSHLLTLCILSSLFTISCEKENVTTPNPTPPVPKDRTETHSLYFQEVDEHYPVSIFIPKEYSENKNLPVLYLLDGLTVYEGLTFFEEGIIYMEEVGLDAILVAIGDKEGLERARDFLAEGCGGGNEEDFNNFYNFITQKVVSFVDSRFESDSTARTLIGFSHGGNFAYNAFLREKRDDIIFHNFISVDPSVCETAVIENHLDNLDFPEHTKFKIHFSKTEFEMGDKIYNAFEERAFDFLELDFKFYPDETHETVPRTSIPRGLKFIFNL